MLDLAHPQTRHIFEASGTEGRIRMKLLGWLNGHELSGRARAEVLDRWLPELHAFNREHFRAAPHHPHPGRPSHSRAGHRRHVPWKCFLALVDHPGGNFGTWMI